MDKDLNTSEIDSNINLNFTEAINHNNSNQRGGFLFGSSSDNDKKVLMAARQQKYEVVSFMIKNNMIQDYGVVDDYGCTLLHYLAKDYKINVENVCSVDIILSKSNVKSFINIQDKNGDTPIHIAVKSGNNEMAAKLDSSGANMDIKNKQGFRVDGETVDSVNYARTASPRMSEQHLDNIVNQDNQDDRNTQNITQDTIKNIVNKFLTIKQPKNMTSSAHSIMNTDTRNDSSRNNSVEFQNSDTLSTSRFIDQLMNKYSSNLLQQQPQHQQQGSGRDYESESDSSVNSKSYINTENFLDNIANGINNIGGARKKNRSRSGSGSDIYNLTKNDVDSEEEPTKEDSEKPKRKTRKSKNTNNDSALVYSLTKNDVDSEEESTKEDSEKPIKKTRKSKSKKQNTEDDAEQETRLDERGTQLSRMINNQAGEIHKRVLQKIMDILKIDEATARNYKAVLWSTVKKNKDLKTNLDQSVELEKITTKENLEKLDPKKGEKMREESRKARDIRMKEKGDDTSSDKPKEKSKKRKEP
jgi:ankyrin repeat protein